MVCVARHLRGAPSSTRPHPSLSRNLHARAARAPAASGACCSRAPRRIPEFYTCAAGYPGRPVSRSSRNCLGIDCRRLPSSSASAAVAARGRCPSSPGGPQHARRPARRDSRAAPPAAGRSRSRPESGPMLDFARATIRPAPCSLVALELRRRRARPRAAAGRPGEPVTRSTTSAPVRSLREMPRSPSADAVEPTTAGQQSAAARAGPPCCCSAVAASAADTTGSTISSRTPPILRRLAFQRRHVPRGSKLAGLPSGSRLSLDEVDARHIGAVVIRRGTEVLSFRIVFTDQINTLPVSARDPSGQRPPFEIVAASDIASVVLPVPGTAGRARETFRAQAIPPTASAPAPVRCCRRAVSGARAGRQNRPQLRCAATGEGKSIGNASNSASVAYFVRLRSSPKRVPPSRAARGRSASTADSRQSSPDRIAATFRRQCSVPASSLSRHSRHSRPRSGVPVGSAARCRRRRSTGRNRAELRLKASSRLLALHDPCPARRRIGRDAIQAVERLCRSEVRARRMRSPPPLSCIGRMTLRPSGNT